MTEKKYMTASEFLEKKDCICFRDDGSRELYSLSDSDEEDMTDENILKELDAHFINKEKLKNKIKLLGHKWELKVINNYNIDTPRDLYIVDFTKEILEMLK